MISTTALCAAVLATAIAGPCTVAAADLVPQPALTLAAASRLATAAGGACRQLDRTIAVAVLDGGGHLLVLERDPAVGPHNIEAARRKAFTALSTRTATLDLARRAARDADSRNLNTLPELLLLGGGVPLMSAGQPVGAIGVAGGGGAGNDHACALAALAAVPALDQPVTHSRE